MGGHSTPQDDCQLKLVPCTEMKKDPSIHESEHPSEQPSGNVAKTIQSGSKGKKSTAKVLITKNVLRSASKNVRVLRLRSEKFTTTGTSSVSERESATGTSNGLEGAASRGKRKRKKRNQIVPCNEFLKARKRLHYILQRMGYEQSLIDVYSSEGWKGLSLDKLKPDKELQRAKNEILRCKSRIRALFQHLNELCAEGRLQDSLFDEEGQIASEDIFCSKCGSKDLSTDNDIILCDGVCERGFHQFCLEPPLPQIPEGDDGWLCPCCDCKDYCVDLLNESLGTNFSIEDSWEKIFPEAAPDLLSKDNYAEILLSDNSDDGDYEPDNQKPDTCVHEGDSGSDESSSDQSDFTSASGDVEITRKAANEQYLDLPSDDSEDDDYDPDAPNVEEQDFSSGSDFSSDSEDLDAVLQDNSSPGKADPVPVEPKREDAELLSPLEENFDLDSTPISGGRHVDRLDYKKLYDEAYGEDSTDSSEDEDWADTTVRKGKNGHSNSQVHASEAISVIKEEVRVEGDMQVDSLMPEKSPSNQKANEGCSGRSGPCSDTSTSRGSWRKLGDSATQGLYEAFKKNHYPDRALKEKLSWEYGLTVKQVTKWFDNARHSIRQSSMEEGNDPKCKIMPQSRSVGNGQMEKQKEDTKAEAIPLMTSVRRKLKAKRRRKAMGNKKINKTSQ